MDIPEINPKMVVIKNIYYVYIGLELFNKPEPAGLFL
jgi:hypothetical protein